MKVAKLLAMVAVVGFVSSALLAADSTKAKAVYGKIVKVEDKALTIKTKVKEGEGKEITIAVDDKTVITLDKKEAKLADLKADMMCRITPDTASDKVAAETISAFTPKAPK